jgi:DNA-binding LacI/PurR family transcriptional regulator
MKRMLKASTLPTAVFCANDDSAFGAMEAIAEAGLSVPGDISVVGFDDVPLANHSKPPLTTLQQPVENIARASASALISYIENRTPIAGRSFKGALIERASTGVVPGAKLPVSDQSKKNSLVNKRLTS